MKIYKSIYKEAAVSPSEIISNPNFCLFIGKEKSYKDMVLYDKSGIIKDISSKKNIKIDLNFIYAFGEMETSKANPYNCWSVIRSAAVKNYGAFLYDTMLSIAGEFGLMPDRGSVSKDAMNVWEYYFTKRQNEFKLIKIDNFKDPETIDKKDDSFVHYPIMKYDNRNFVDYIYYFKNYNKHLKFVKILKQNNMSFIKELSSKGFNTLDFKLELLNNGATFFSDKYNT